MAFPSITVEIAFTTDPGDTPVWTDVTEYSEGIATISAGRDSELVADFQPGQLELVLSNTDRRFEPEYAASPYYPNVIPMRRIRIRAVWATVTYDLFNGYVERWPLVYEDPAQATVTITAVDGFAVLAQASLPASVWELEVKTDSPRAWYRLGESSGTTAGDSSGNGYHGTYEGGATFDSRIGLIAKDPDNAIYFNGIDNAMQAPSGASVSVAPFSIECWIKRPAGATGTLVRQGDYPYRGTLGLYFDASYLTFHLDGDEIRTAHPSAGAVHHIVAVKEASATVRLYVDGVQAASGFASRALSAFPIRVGSSADFGFFTGEIDEVAIYPTALSAARVSAHYAAGTNAWSNDLSGTRVAKVLDSIGWPAADRSIDVGKSMLQATSLGGKALPYLQAVTRSEGGALHMTLAGKLRFRNRHATITAPLNASLATFGDDGAELPYSALEPDYDVDKVRNVIRRGRTGGPVFTASDAASIAKYFERTDERTDSMVASDAEVADSAYWALSHLKDPGLRFEAMDVEPYGEEANLYPQMLGRSLGERITVRRRPPGGGVAVEREVVIEGIRHIIGPGPRWRATWRLSPAEAEYWVWGTSTWGETTRWGW